MSAFNPYESTTGSDRRAHPRLPARNQSARLAWEDGLESYDREARLIDISRGGAMMVVDGMGPSSSPVRMLLVGLGATAWIDARLIRSSPSQGDEFLVRIAFYEPCPEAVFEVAIGGAGDEEAAREVPASRSFA